jgi:hypothetical protein
VSENLLWRILSYNARKNSLFYAKTIRQFWNLTRFLKIPTHPSFPLTSGKIKIHLPGLVKFLRASANFACLQTIKKLFDVV